MKRSLIVTGTFIGLIVAGLIGPSADRVTADDAAMAAAAEEGWDTV